MCASYVYLESELDPSVMFTLETPPIFFCLRRRLASSITPYSCPFCPPYITDDTLTHVSSLAHALARGHTRWPHVALGGKRCARRGGMAMVQDTQGKRWKRRIPARPARVLWQEALLTSVPLASVCWLRFGVCPRERLVCFVHVV